MRGFVFILLAAVGAVCIYLFATGAVSEGGGHQLFVSERALMPFANMTPSSALVLVTAAVAFLLALAFLAGGSHTASRIGGSWTRTLQLAFLGNVAMVGVILAILFFTTRSFPREAAYKPAIGAIYLVGALEAALGSCLALSLLFLKKPRFLFVSTLVAHAAEIGLLCLVFFLGTTN